MNTLIPKQYTYNRFSNPVTKFTNLWHLGHLQNPSARMSFHRSVT